MTEIFQKILMASFHGSVVIGVLLLLRPLLKKTGKGLWCLLWLLAFLRLSMPFEIVSPASIQPEPINWQEIRLLIAERRQEPQGEGDLDLPMPDDVSPASDPERPPDPAEAPEAAPAAGGWIPRLWLTVAAGLILYALIAYGRLKWQVREAIRISPGVWESGRIGTAFLLGFFLPRIYLPTGLSQENRRYILDHERAHLKRGDHIYKLFAFLILALHWFNPLVWVAHRLVGKDIEMACDERVVRELTLEQRKAYSLALLDCSVSRAPFASPVAFGEISVKERVKSVMRYRKPSFWLSLAGVAAVAFVGICLLTSPKPEEAQAAANVPASPQTEASTVPPRSTLSQAPRQTVNILLVGTKYSGGLPLSDTLLLLTVDRKTGETVISSFLPELHVKFPDLWGHKSGKHQINTAYTLGFAWQGESGAREMLGTLLREQFGVTVDYTIEIGQDTVKAVVDGLGGVDIALTQQEAKAMAISAEGAAHLDGQAALSFGTLTLPWETTSVRLAERQRALLGGVLDALSGVSDAQRQELVTELLPSVLTDITEETLLSLAELPLQLPAQTVQIPAEGTYQEKEVEMYNVKTHALIPDIPENKALLRDLSVSNS